MSLSLNPAELWQLYTSAPPGTAKDKLRHELFFFQAQAIGRLIKSPTGMFGGHPVVKDDKGPMATGYWCYRNMPGYPPTDKWDEIVHDPYTPEQQMLRNLRSALMKRWRDTSPRRAT